MRFGPGRLVELGRFKESEAYFRRTLERRPNSYSPLNGLAWLLLTAPDHRQCRPEEALDLSRRAVKDSPLANNLNTLGIAEYRNGLWDQAIATLHKSTEMNKGMDPTDFFFTGMAHWRRGDRDEAERSFRRGVDATGKQTPLQWDTRSIWAEAAELMGKPGPVPTLFEV